MSARRPTASLLDQDPCDLPPRAASAALPSFQAKAKIEAMVQASGLGYAILRCTTFMDNYGSARQPLIQGSLQGIPGPNTKVQLIALDGARPRRIHPSPAATKNSVHGAR